jgi:hypothetical protein
MIPARSPSSPLTSRRAVWLQSKLLGMKPLRIRHYLISAVGPIGVALPPDFLAAATFHPEADRPPLRLPSSALQ